jgi:hypothetical protein
LQPLTPFPSGAQPAHSEGFSYQGVSDVSMTPSAGVKSEIIVEVNERQTLLRMATIDHDGGG